MRIVGEFWGSDCKENLCIFWVNFENIRNFIKYFEITPTNFEKVLELLTNFGICGAF